MFRSILLLSVFSLAGWFAVDTALAAVGSKPDLSGDWQATVTGGSGSKLTITEDANSEKVRIVETSDAAQDNKTEFDCSVRGKECTGKVDGEPAKITVYYNGPTLVELAVQGKDGKKVTKTRRTLSPDGKSLIVETLEIVPPGGKSEKVTYTRAATDTAQH